MWPWKKSSAKVEPEPVRYVAIHYGYGQQKRKVFRTPLGFACNVGSEICQLEKSTNGKVGRGVREWFPLEGWTRAELRELGFAVPSDDLVPEHVQLAKAVLAGDRGAALALADWIVEHWGDADRGRVGIIRFADDAREILQDYQAAIPIVAPIAGGYEVTWNLRPSTGTLEASE